MPGRAFRDSTSRARNLGVTRLPAPQYHRNVQAAYQEIMRYQSGASNTVNTNNEQAMGAQHSHGTARHAARYIALETKHGACECLDALRHDFSEGCEEGRSRKAAAG